MNIRHDEDLSMPRAHINKLQGRGIFSVGKCELMASILLLAFSAHAQVAVETAGIASTTKANSKGVAQTPTNAGDKQKKATGGKTPAAKSATMAAGSSTQAMTGLSCVGDLPPPVAMSVTVGKSTLLKLPSPIVRRTLGNEDVVQAKQLGPQTVYLLGIKVGSTNMILQDKAGKCALVDVDVGVDPGGLKTKLQQLMPGEKGIVVSSAAGALMLSGEVTDAYKADRAMTIAAAYAGGDQAQKVINMLNVAAPQQVMLEVQVAEVAKTLLDKLGGAFSLSKLSGNWKYTLLSNYLTATAGSGLTARSNNGNNSFAFDAEKDDGLVKILAEPNIMAISGQEGAFLAGGKIFIPVSSSNQNGILTIGLEEREFGVGLKFTPTVLEGGLINLKVAPEVSELSPAGISISAAGTSNASILPVITTRRASTTVQLYDGQSFAIGGLIKNNVTQNISAFPMLGEIPVLGALFRSSSFQSDKSELLIVVTPHLVKPLPPDYRLPTDSFVEPSRSEFFLGGKMEGSEPSSQNFGKKAPSSSQTPSGFEVK